MKDGGFTLVARRGRGDGRGRLAHNRGDALDAHGARSGGGRESASGQPSLTRVAHGVTAASGASDAAQLARLDQRIEACKAELRSSPFLAELLSGVLQPAGPFRALLCLGVGSFASSRQARYQLALALVIRDWAGGDPTHATKQTVSNADSHGGVPSNTDAPSFNIAKGAKVALHVYDPVFDAVELEWLRQQAECWLRPCNEEGRIAVNDLNAELDPGLDSQLHPGKVLCYMPHCTRQLYSNLLDANWGPARLLQLAVLGNSFEAFADAPTDAERRSNASWCRVTRAWPLVTERACDNLGGCRAADFEYAFTCTSLHTFARDAPDATDPLWSDPFGEAPLLSNQESLVGAFPEG